MLYLSYQNKDFDRTGNAYIKNLKRWEKDYQLQELDRLHLFDEYIEMSKIHFINVPLSSIGKFRHNLFC